VQISPFWAQFLLTVAIGTLAGGVTNMVAVWMLFHPYERRFGIQGAIPKNKARLARSIGRTVGEKLLTPADVVAELDRSGLRVAVEERLAEIVASLLDEERGSIRDLLPPELFAEVERALGGIGERLAEGYVAHVHSPAFEESVQRFVVHARAQVQDVPLSHVLTPERRSALAQQAAALSTELIEASRQDEGRSTRARLGDFILKLAGSERTERFVERTVGEALERAEGRTVGDILDTVPDQTYAEWLLRAARSPQAAEFAMRTAGTSARQLLDTPIGKPSRWLPPDAPARLAHVAGPALWGWALSQLPGLLERLNIEGMVERKVLGFSTERIEQVVRGVTERELRLIVRLGYVLGAVIGAATFGVRQLF
jgi:uncharacterized membrane protein YheB (UPF0754 family)